MRITAPYGRRICRRGLCNSPASYPVGRVGGGTQRCAERLVLAADDVVLCALYRAFFHRQVCSLAFVFALGLMAKPMLVTLPVILLLLDYWPLKRKDSLTKLLLEKLPFVFLAGVSSVVALVVQSQSGAVRDIVKFPFDIRVINALVSYVKYILKMFWPVNLSVFYFTLAGHFIFLTRLFPRCCLSRQRFWRFVLPEHAATCYSAGCGISARYYR